MVTTGRTPEIRRCGEGRGRVGAATAGPDGPARWYWLARSTKNDSQSSRGKRRGDIGQDMLEATEVGSGSRRKLKRGACVENGGEQIRWLLARMDWVKEVGKNISGSLSGGTGERGSKVGLEMGWNWWAQV